LAAGAAAEGRHYSEKRLGHISVDAAESVAVDVAVDADFLIAVAAEGWSQEVQHCWRY
jgi:hypothetical protein